jgi:hypothetical protein
MSTLKHLISTKNDIEQKVTDLFAKYFAKRIKKFYHNSLDQKYVYREFQKNLFELANWSSLKISKEYKKFLKWCLKKYDLTESEIVKLINTLINTSIKLILYTSSNESIFDKIFIPPLEIFFYRGLKQVARFYYEHPKQEIHSSDIKEIFNVYIQKYIPFKDIINILDNDVNIELEDPKILTYNFDDLDSNSDDSKIVKKNLIIEKQQSESDLSGDDLQQNYLKYVSSDDFNIESVEAGLNPLGNDDLLSDLEETGTSTSLQRKVLYEGDKNKEENNEENKDIKYINLKGPKKYNYSLGNKKYKNNFIDYPLPKLGDPEFF